MLVRSISTSLRSGALRSVGIPFNSASLYFDFTNTNALDPRITFNRSTTGTYYNSAGVLSTAAINAPRFDYNPSPLIEESRTNLLLYSEQFNNAAWTPAGMSVQSNNALAPDGTLTADKIIPSAVSTQFKEIQQNTAITTGTTYTFSCYVKAAGYSYIQFVGTGSVFGSFSINYDLSTGIETAFSAGTSTVVGRNITPAGSDWYRVSVSVTTLSASAGARIAVNVIPDSNSARGVAWAGNGTSGILQWGAQMEVGAFPTSYIQTVASQVTREARYGSPTPAGLLMEEQRTNIALSSGDALSGGVGVTIDADQITAPDGSLADFVKEDTTSAEHYAGDRTFTVTSGVTYCWSFFAKLGSGSPRRVYVRTALQGSAGVIFNIATGGSDVISSAALVSSGIQDVGNGWKRCWIVYTATGTGTAVFRQQLSDVVTPIYTGNGTSGLYIWGAQLEVGTSPTSYIPTTASQVTRSADLAVMTGTNFSDWFNASEGTFYLDADMYETQAGFFRHFLVANDASGSGADFIGFSSPSNTSAVSARIVAASTTQCSMQSTLTLGAAFKAGFAYDTNNSAVSYNGATVVADNSVTLPTGVNRLYIGGFADTGVGTSSSTNIRQIAYYPRRLSNTELQAITK